MIDIFVSLWLQCFEWARISYSLPIPLHDVEKDNFVTDISAFNTTGIPLIKSSIDKTRAASKELKAIDERCGYLSRDVYNTVLLRCKSMFLNFFFFFFFQVATILLIGKRMRESSVVSVRIELNITRRSSIVSDWRLRLVAQHWNFIAGYSTFRYILYYFSSSSPIPLLLSLAKELRSI